MTDIQPQYSGVSFIEIKISDIQVRFPEINKMVGRGMALAISPGKGLLMQQNGDKSCRNYVCKLAPENWLSSLNLSTAKDTRDFLLDLYQDWSEGLKDFIRNCDDEIYPRPLYELPIGHKWEHKAGITLIGDAAHVSF